MEFVYDVAESAVSPAVIKVIGLGGGGYNAINNMVANNVRGVEFISANTDAQSRQKTMRRRGIQLGTNLTRGLGAGANPDIGHCGLARKTGKPLKKPFAVQICCLSRSVWAAVPSGSAAGCC